MSLYVLFVIVALVLFCVAAFPVPSRVNLVAAGLAFYMLALLFGGRALG